MYTVIQLKVVGRVKWGEDRYHVTTETAWKPVIMDMCTELL